MVKTIVRFMKEFFERIHNVVFYRILLLFVIAIFFSTSVLGMLSIYHSTNTIREQVEQSTIKSLNEKKNIIDRNIKLIDDLCYQILNHSNVLKLGYAVTVTHREHLMMLNVISYLKEICSSNDLIDSVYIFNTRHHYIISDTKYNFTDFSDPDALDLALDNQAGKAVFRQFEGRNIISYIYKIDSLFTHNTIVMINLNYTNMFISDPGHSTALFDTLVFSDDSSLIFSNTSTLTSMSREMLLDISNSREPSDLICLNGTEYFICKVSSGILDWNIAFFQPYSSIVEGTSLTRKLITSSIIMVFIFSLLFAYAFSVYIYTPIGRLTTKVKEHNISEVFSTKNAYQSINNALVSLFNKNAELSCKYDAIFPYFRQYSISEILSANPFDMNKFSNILNMLGTRFVYSRYVNILIDFENTCSSDLERNIMDMFLSSYISVVSYIIFNISGNRTSIIINTDLTDPETFHIMESLKQELANSNVISTFAIGNSYDDIRQVHSRYQEALSLMDTKFFVGKNRILLDKDRKKVAQQFIYDKKLEETLISCINNLDKENSVQTLNLLFDKISSLGGSSEYIRYVYFELLCSSMSLLNSMGIDLEKANLTVKDIFFNIQNIDTLSSLSQFAEGVILRFIELIQEYRNMQHEVIIDKAMDFLKANFQTDIRLNEVAKKVYLSSAYLNNLFKTATGSTIYEYTTRLRMEAAAKLLKESNRTTQDVAVQVGYNNVQNFLRLFKKHYKMTPMQFRRSL